MVDKLSKNYARGVINKKKKKVCYEMVITMKHDKWKYARVVPIVTQPSSHFSYSTASVHHVKCLLCFGALAQVVMCHQIPA